MLSKALREHKTVQDAFRFSLFISRSLQSRFAQRIMLFVIEIDAPPTQTALAFRTVRSCRCRLAAAVQTGHSPSPPALPSSLLAWALFSMAVSTPARPKGAVSTSLRCRLTERLTDLRHLALMQGLRPRGCGPRPVPRKTGSTQPRISTDAGGP